MLNQGKHHLVLESFLEAVLYFYNGGISLVFKVKISM